MSSVANAGHVANADDNAGDNADDNAGQRCKKAGTAFLHIFLIIICALFSIYLIFLQTMRIFRCQNHDRNQTIGIFKKGRTSNAQNVNSQIVANS